MKYAQAVISKLENGNWRIFFQSENQIEREAEGPLDEIVNELISASCLPWEQYARPWTLQK